MFSVIFPGQGSQSVGMAKDIYNKFDIIKELFKEADSVLNFSITKLILDGTKGVLAIYIINIITSLIELDFTNNIDFFQSLVAVSAVIGHCFPIWLNFKGGKGVATGFGVIIFLNISVGLIALLIWVSIAKLFKISSLSALISYFFIPILMFFFASENTFLVASLLISLICFLQHKENIKRLINRSEVKI